MARASRTSPPPAPRWTVADVTYDEATHTSRLPDGRDVPHVTHVLSATGVSTDFAEMAGLGPRMRDNLWAARALGSAVHKDCHAADDDDLDMATVDRRVLPFLDAWAAVRRDKGLTPVAHGRERRVFHDLLTYTGILDGLFASVDGGPLVLGDLKTGDPEDAAAHLQTAAYEGALRRMQQVARPVFEFGSEHLRRWAIWLRPGRRVPYTIVDYTSPRRDHHQDFAKFQACLTTYNEQQDRRERVT